MTRINILPPLVADMIAAGEVVERPASVIKELMENSFDAGASKVTVEFKSGGATYIKITDDGCGMSPEDAGIAFTRHAGLRKAGCAGSIIAEGNEIDCMCGQDFLVALFERNVDAFSGEVSQFTRRIIPAGMDI